ncbi:hypothetical protein A1QO_05470 [Vibrio genomosp. F10 str. ZF-129]|uniref:Uncharacterized protein n=2 Tax=Vibrio genomosp. F10 TaxID=723171 RepID=A0A1E5BGQ8_9VIBR|nr:hypothetical protein A1QO_05470 [Vibrio genomosp. F10 str. ZF-129]
MLKLLPSDVDHVRFFEASKKLVLCYSKDPGDTIAYGEGYVEIIRQQHDIDSFMFISEKSPNEKKHWFIVCCDGIIESCRKVESAQEINLMIVSNMKRAPNLVLPENDISTFIIGNNSVENRIDVLKLIGSVSDIEASIKDTHQLLSLSQVKNSISHSDAKKIGTLGLSLLSVFVLVLFTFNFIRPTVIEKTETIRADNLDYETLHIGTPLVAVLKDALELRSTLDQINGIQIDRTVFEKNELKTYYIDSEFISTKTAQNIGSRVSTIDWHLSNKPYFTLNEMTPYHDVIAWHKQHTSNAINVYVDLETALTSIPSTELSITSIRDVKGHTVINAQLTGSSWVDSDFSFLRGITALAPIYAGTITLLNENESTKVSMKLKIVGDNHEHRSK